MLEVILLIAVGLLLPSLGLSCFFLWKFAKIIMIFEDDLSEATNNLNEVEDALEGVLTMQMFFDSPEVKQSVQSVIEQVKLCRISISKVVERFTARSKQQYTTVWVEGEADLKPRVPVMPGQPPGSINPLETIMETTGRNS